MTFWELRQLFESSIPWWLPFVVGAVTIGIAWFLSTEDDDG